jgi:hypothetical protein
MRGYVDAMTAPARRTSVHTATPFPVSISERTASASRVMSRTVRRVALCVALMTCLAAVGAAQNVEGGRDTVAIAVPDTLRPQTDGTSARETKSPWGAVWRSAVLPGWGQYYTEHYWKIPIVVGVSGFLIYGIVSENKQYLQYADAYDASITPDNPSGDLTLKSYREYYRDRRDTYAVWMLVTYLVQLADAYVDAHLYDFDVSDDLSASITVLPGAASFTLRW